VKEIMRISQSADAADAVPTQDVRVVAASAVSVVERQPAFQFAQVWSEEAKVIVTNERD